MSNSRKARPGGPYQRPVKPSFIGQEDTEVLAMAKAALQHAEILPIGSRSRYEQWFIFDAAMSELARRAMSSALWKIHEREQQDRSETRNSDDTKPDGGD
jgi:hypothetical protein